MKTERPTWTPARATGETVDYRNTPFWFYFKTDAEEFSYCVRVGEEPTHATSTNPVERDDRL